MKGYCQLLSPVSFIWAAKVGKIPIWHKNAMGRYPPQDEGDQAQRQLRLGPVPRVPAWPHEDDPWFLQKLGARGSNYPISKDSNPNNH